MLLNTVDMKVMHCIQMAWPERPKSPNFSQNYKNYGLSRKGSNLYFEPKWIFIFPTKHPKAILINFWGSWLFSNLVYIVSLTLTYYSNIHKDIYIDINVNNDINIDEYKCRLVVKNWTDYVVMLYWLLDSESIEHDSKDLNVWDDCTHGEPAQV